PSLKGKPIIVGGHNERGVVCACSYETRKYGVHSAMPMKTAMRLCPQAIVVSGSYKDYGKYSQWVTDIIAAKAPLYEKASVDEFYIDLTGMERFFDPYQWTINLREEIIKKTDLPISFGMASSKLVAKIATDEAKPNGYLYVPFGMEKEFLAPLNVAKIPGVGKHTCKALYEMGIITIRDISNQSPTLLEKYFGKYGTDLWNKSNGISGRQVVHSRVAKSISTENTFFENKTDVNFLLSEVVRMTEKIAYELRQDNMTAGCIAVKIRYPDFETTSKQTSIDHTFYDDKLILKAKELFRQLYKAKKPVRLLGVRLSHLIDEAIQSDLFDNSEKKTALYKSIDEVKNRFGTNSISKAVCK
ncbi:MAG TPA: DNA polymerase IV, partial [Puia sp.]|nr:DNA polymerase IV [Puia sp.]